MDSSSDLSDPPSSDPPSSPLSVLSKSPSLSPQLSPQSRYPSPLSTAPSGSTSPMKDSICVNPDGAPPAKRRKTEPKPRTTERLNLRASYEHSEEDEDLLGRLTSALRKKKKIVVIAGAGISVSAGSTLLPSLSALFATQILTFPSLQFPTSAPPMAYSRLCEPNTSSRLPASSSSMPLFTSTIHQRHPFMTWFVN